MLVTIVSGACMCACLCCGLLYLQDDLLYTLNVQCPQSRWPEDGDALKQAAASLRLQAKAGNQQFPGALS
jgi:hypothetical protein